MPPAVSRFGNDDPAWRERSAKALATVLHLHRGTPLVDRGEELDLAEAGVPVPVGAELLFGNVPVREGPTESGVLRGWEARVYRTTS